MVGFAALYPPYDLLRQRLLQIEARVGRLLRRDRAAHAEQAAAEHVVAGAVDGFDAEQRLALVAEDRECPLGGITAQHDAIIAGGKAGDLQLVVALVAPEPGLAIVGLVVAREPSRHAARLVGGVL